ncbi:MAG: hypothetical protein ACYDCL_17470 [Myxococcales bacterium]
MSKIRTADGEDYPEAAGKHLADASALLMAHRPDGAAYLCGYVVECVLKTIVFLEGGDPHGHLQKLSPAALQLAGVPGAKTAKYFRAPATGHPMYTAPGGWAPALRYRPEKTVAPETAQSWFHEAEAIYTSTLVPMFLDGLI